MADDDEAARKEQAARLLAEIEALKAGRRGPPKSPRDFVDSKRGGDAETETPPASG